MVTQMTSRNTINYAVDVNKYLELVKHGHYEPYLLLVHDFVGSEAGYAGQLPAGRHCYLHKGILFTVFLAAKQPLRTTRGSLAVCMSH